MTLRLGLIGNSHVAAFATGWPHIEARYPGVEITFFAARAAQLSELVVRDDSLQASTRPLQRMLEWTSKGSTAIVPGAFDEVWLVGLGFGIETAIAAYASCRSDSHRADDSKIRVSDAFFAATMRSALRRSLAIDLYRKVRTIGATPVRIVAQPNPSTEALRSTLDRLVSFQRAAENGDEAVLWSQYREAIDAVSGEIDAAIALQPDDSRDRAIFTNAVWGEGSIRLQRGMEAQHARADALHMNAEFGAAMLDRDLPAMIARRS